jgi:KDO2-lipid IV(A) lauroyltransferase
MAAGRRADPVREPLPRALLAPRHWPTWLALGVLLAFARLPWCVQRAVGAGLGWVGHAVARRRRGWAATNLSLCFPELDAAARRRLLRANFRSLGLGLVEFARTWWGGSIQRQAEGSQLHGVEKLESVLAAGRGVILLSGHFHTLEICGRILTTRVPVAGLYRRHRNPVMEWAVRRGRLRYAQAMFAREELRPAVRHLKAGGVLWYAPDQDMLGRDAVFAPFFGLPAQTITATHQLARLTGAAVFGFFHRRRDDGRGYVIRIEGPLDDFPGADVVVDATRINGLIEAMVREAPAEYLWVHRRFKRRPGGEGSYYE